MVLLEVSHISKAGRDGFSLQEVNFIQANGQRVAIAGETGSGKTTLLKIIAGLVQPDTGQVIFEGVKVVGPLDKLIPGHPKIAYLSQHFELRNNYRVEEILSYANKISDHAANDLYVLCQIDHLLKRKTDQLSGGEKQRIALARLLIGSPRLLVLDEPFSNLDLGHKQLLKTVLQNIGRELGINCILSSHDPADTLSWADEILVMQAGRIIQQADPESIYYQPVNEYTGGLFGTYSLISAGLAATYPTEFPFHPTGKRVFTRPEQFRILPEQDGGIKARVAAVNFMGGYYEIVVQVGKDVILVRSATGKYTIGGSVHIARKASDYWCL